MMHFSLAAGTAARTPAVGGTGPFDGHFDARRRYNRSRRCRHWRGKMWRWSGRAWQSRGLEVVAPATRARCRHQPTVVAPHCHVWYSFGHAAPVGAAICWIALQLMQERVGDAGRS